MPNYTDNRVKMFSKMKTSNKRCGFCRGKLYCVWSDDSAFADKKRFSFKLYKNKKQNIAHVQSYLTNIYFKYEDIKRRTLKVSKKRYLDDSISVCFVCLNCMLPVENEISKSQIKSK